MNNKVIRIDTECEAWFLYSHGDEWMNCVCPDDKLKEKCVVYGNRDYQEYKEAKWYVQAVEILKDIDCGHGEDSIREWYNLSKDLYSKIEELFDKCSYYEQILLDVIKLLNPKKEFETTCIRGCVQREWQNVIYEKDAFDTEILADFYFGKITEFSLLEDDEYENTIFVADSQVPYKTDDLKKFARELFEISEDEDVRIETSDGYVRVKQWKDVA